MNTYKAGFVVVCRKRLVRRRSGIIIFLNLWWRQLVTAIKHFALDRDEYAKEQSHRFAAEKDESLLSFIQLRC